MKALKLQSSDAGKASKWIGSSKLWRPMNLRLVNATQPAGMRPRRADTVAPRPRRIRRPAPRPFNAPLGHAVGGRGPPAAAWLALLAVLLLATLATAQVVSGGFSGTLKETTTQQPLIAWSIVTDAAPFDTMVTDSTGHYESSPTTGTDDVPRLGTIMVYPNPASGTLNITTTDKSAHPVKIYDLKGAEHTRDDRLPSGVYVATDGVSRIKFTVTERTAIVVTSDASERAQRTISDDKSYGVTYTIINPVTGATTDTIVTGDNQQGLTLYAPNPTDTLEVQLLNNDTEQPLPGEIKVFGDGNLLGVWSTDDNGQLTLPLQADYDTLEVRARGFTNTTNPDVGDTTFVRTVFLPVPGATTITDTIRAVQRNDIQNMPPNQDYPWLTPEQNFGNLCWDIMCGGAPDSYHTHPWDWDGDEANYVTDTGKPIVAIIRYANGDTLSENQIAQITAGFMDVFNTYGLGTNDIRVYDTTEGLTKVVNGSTVPADGYFLVKPDFGGIPGNANISTWSDSDDGHWYMEGAAMAVNSWGSALYEAARIEAASGWGCRDPPTFTDPWAQDVTYFDEYPHVTDFTTVDVKMMNILRHMPPSHIYNILGFQEQWDAPAGETTTVWDKNNYQGNNSTLEFHVAPRPTPVRLGEDLLILNNGGATVKDQSFAMRRRGSGWMRRR